MSTNRQIDRQDQRSPHRVHPVTDAARVARDTTLTIEERRAILASWASDFRAVVDHPSLRRLDNGSLVEIDDILDSLKQLDGLPDRSSSSERRDWSYRRGHWSRLGRRWRRDDEDDDDPPTPAPAAARPRPPVLEGGLAVAA